MISCSLTIKCGSLKMFASQFLMRTGITAKKFLFVLVIQQLFVCIDYYFFVNTCKYMFGCKLEMEICQSVG